MWIRASPKTFARAFRKFCEFRIRFGRAWLLKPREINLGASSSSEREPLEAQAQVRPNLSVCCRSDNAVIMKKIIQREEAELVCDVTGKPAVAKLTLEFWYGSRHDMQALEVDLSDETSDQILQLLQSKYPQFRLKDVNW